MEGLGETGPIGEAFDYGEMGRLGEDENESKSMSDNMDARSRGDHQETSRATDESRRKKACRRHTLYQIQELEASFKENPHPDEMQRLLLCRILNLEAKQVKFWFQNRQTQVKTHNEHHENLMLRKENGKLRLENVAMKEATKNPICKSCRGTAVQGDIASEEHQLRTENARLQDELDRLYVLRNKFLSRPLPAAVSDSNLELPIRRNGFGVSYNADAALPIGLDMSNEFSNAWEDVPSSRPFSGTTDVDIPSEKSMFLELALAAMNELVKLAHADASLWLKKIDGSGETLNFDEYITQVTPSMNTKTRGLASDGTRASGILTISSMALVEMMMDANRWAETFPALIGSSSTLDMIAPGMDGTRNGALQMMLAEFQIISPSVPVRQVRFLRFCKKHQDGVWAVVDVSIDAIPAVQCKRLPSGFIVQDLPDGNSEVIWVEHSEYDESVIHQFYQPFLRSGMGYGAQRWVATLQRQSNFMEAIVSSTLFNEDHLAIPPNGRRNMAKLAQWMTHNFCAGVCATLHKWEVIQVGNIGEDARLMIRKGFHNPGAPSEEVLSATMSVWMPVQQQRLCDILQDEQLRSQWDVLSHGTPMQHLISIAKGQDQRNSVSLLRASVKGANTNQNNMLILQEMSTDASGSLMVFAAFDASALNTVIYGGDSPSVTLLPCGFAIVPDCLKSGGPNNCGGMAAKEGRSSDSGSGCLLTLGFQILVNELPAPKLTSESVVTVNSLIRRTVQRIKEALRSS